MKILVIDNDPAWLAHLKTTFGPENVTTDPAQSYGVIIARADKVKPVIAVQCSGDELGESMACFRAGAQDYVSRVYDGSIADVAKRVTGNG